MKKTEVIQLADENEYTLTTLNVGDLIAIEEEFGDITINTAKTKNVMYWLWLSVKKVHKDMTLDELYELIDTPFLGENGLTKIIESMIRLNGWDKISKNVESLVEKKQV